MKYLLYLLIFFLASSFLFSYYNQEFDSKDELDYYYELGLIDDDEYREYEEIFDYLDENKDEEKEAFDKNLYGNIKFFSELTDYREKTNDILSGIRLEKSFAIEKNKNKFLNLNLGTLILNKNKLYKNYNSDEKIFTDENYKKINSLDKFFLDLSFSNYKILVGDYRARFGMGLTFSKSNSLKEGFYGDTSMPHRLTFRTRNNEIKREMIDNNYLHGVSISKKYKDFEFFYIFSEEKNPLNDINVLDLEGNKKAKSVNSLDNEKINLLAINYNFLNFLKSSVIWFEAKNNYYFDVLSSKNTDALGGYFLLNFNNFFYENELTFLNEKKAFINKFGFNDNETLNFYILYRNYPSDYKNDFSNSYRARPNQKYFYSSDEEGVKFDFSYKYKFKTKDFLKFEILGNLYSYSKKREKISSVYELIYYPKIYDKTYSIFINYNKKNLSFDVKYKNIDRDLDNISNNYYSRKDENYEVSVSYNTDIFNIRYSYIKKYKAIDCLDKKYYSEYMKYFFKVFLSKKNNTFLSLNTNITDTYVDKDYDDIITYSILFNSQLIKTFLLKFRWNIKSYKQKDFLDYDDDKLYFYNTIFLDKWKLEIEYKF